MYSAFVELLVQQSHSRRVQVPNFSFVPTFVGRLCLNSLLSSPLGAGVVQPSCAVLGFVLSLLPLSLLWAHPGHALAQMLSVLSLVTLKWFCSELSGAAGAQGRCPGHKQLFRLPSPAFPVPGRAGLVLPFSSTSSDSTAWGS